MRITAPRALGALVSLALVAATGCDSDRTEHGATTVVHEDPATPSPELPRLRLNDGARWQVDASTRAIAARLHAAVDDATLTSPDDARALGADLQSHLGELIAGCTMTGPGHDQLHVFLVGFMPVADRLAQRADLDEARGDLALLRRALADYDRHFE